MSRAAGLGLAAAGLILTALVAIVLILQSGETLVAKATSGTGTLLGSTPEPPPPAWGQPRLRPLPAVVTREPEPTGTNGVSESGGDPLDQVWDLARDGRLRITGRAATADGTGVPGVDVAAHLGDQRRQRATAPVARARTDASGAYTINLLRTDASPCVTLVVRFASGSRWSHAEPETHVVTGDTEHADFTLVPLPAVRVRVVDAIDGRPLPDAAADGWHTERDGDALVVYLSGHFGSKRGSLAVGFSAPGYLPAQAWISPPDAGVAVRDEPVALEPSVEAAGVLRKRTGAGVAGWVIAEPLDVDSVEPPLTGAESDDDGTWRLPLRAGRYRLLALVFGRPAWRGTLPVAHGAEPTEILVAEPGEEVPAAPRFTWAQRRDLELPVTLPAMAFGGLERVRWLAEIADAPIAVDDDVAARLARSTAPALGAGQRLHRALGTTAREASLDFDDAAARIVAPQPR